MLIPNITINDVLLRLSENERYVCALAGGEDGWGTILAWNPVEIFESLDQIEIEKFVNDESAKDRFVVGYMTYDLGAELQGVSLKAIDDLGMPNVYILSFENYITFGQSGADTTNDELVDILKRPKQEAEYPLYNRDFQPTMSRDEYGKKFQKIQQYICAGDVYQVNLTHRLETTTNAGGRQIFAKSVVANRANFAGYIEGRDFEIISNSPERFVRIDSGIIETLPIKGTRPRGQNLEDDMRQKNELADSPKDTAELNMITDLMRNDLGKICKIGSVAVKQNRVITELPTVWHAHSHIVGQLNSDISPITALLSLMPGGSITGCPKKRSIQIIDELEPVRRGVYTGTIFSVKPGGSLDSNIAIRTIIKKSNKLSLSVGGGIVHDSNENDEYQESLDKAVFWRQLGASTLSSDILESQFGPTHIVVLFQNENERIICTKTDSDNRILELSYVKFMENGRKNFPKVHAEIVAGKSMGKAFRDHGISFVRNQKSVGRTDVPKIFQQKFGSTDLPTVINVQINVGEESIPYAEILEIYSPYVTWPDKAQTAPQNSMIELENFANKLTEL